MQKPTDVAVFWDVDSCPIPRLARGYDMVNKIRLLSQNYGMVKSLKAYSNVSGLTRNLALRSELQCSGVSLTYCPANEKSASSPMMIVDILAHAMDHSPSTTFVIIAGNDDYAYAISILSMRRYPVVFVSLKDRIGSQSQASAYYDWFHDLLSPEYEFDDTINSLHTLNSRSRGNSFSTAVTHPESFVTAPSQDLEFFAQSDGSSQSSTTQSSSSCRDETPRATSNFRVNTSRTTVPEEQVSASLAQDTTTPTRPAFQSENQHEAISDGDGSDHPDEKDEFTYLDNERPSSAPPSYTSFTPVSTPLAEDLMSRGMPYGVDVPTPSFTEDWEGQSFEQQGIAMNRSASSSEYHSDASSETIRDLPAPMIPRPGPPQSQHIPVSTPSLSSASATPTPALPVPLLTPIPTPTRTPIPISPPLPGPPVQCRPPVPEYIPAPFVALVKRLQEERQKKGETKAFRPGIAAQITSTNMKDLKEIGATNFTAFARMAEQAGIVELPGPEGGLWIALRPELYDVAVD